MSNGARKALERNADDAEFRRFSRRRRLGSDSGSAFQLFASRVPMEETSPSLMFNLGITDFKRVASEAGHLFPGKLLQAIILRLFQGFRVSVFRLQACMRCSAEVVNPNFRLFDTIVSGSRIAMFRGMGWVANNGGGHFEFNTSARDSFIRSTDDLIKVRGGNIVTENLVLWQSYNGGTFQFGWAGLHLVNITHRTASVIENEWRAPEVWETYDTRPNNAVVSLVDANPEDPAQLVGPFVWQDLQIDGDVSHPLSLHLENGFLGNMLFDGLTISGKVTRFAFATAVEGSATIANVTFRNFTIEGRSCLFMA